jgi:hypothetical protein
MREYKDNLNQILECDSFKDKTVVRVPLGALLYTGVRDSIQLIFPRTLSTS